MFWKHSKSKEGEAKLPAPKEIPEVVGRHLVTEEKMSPDLVWRLKAAVRPTENKKVFHCRVFEEGKVTQAGVKVKDWTSLDNHPDLIVWEGYLDKDTGTARREKFAQPTHSQK